MKIEQSIVGVKKSRLSLSYFSILLILLMLALLTALIFVFVINAETNASKIDYVAFSFLLNGIVGCVFLVQSITRASFSLVQMHWVFYVTMFVVAPFSQYLFHYYPWNYYSSSEAYFRANILLLIWAGLFALFSNITFKKKRLSYRSQSLAEFCNSIPRISDKALTTATCIACIAALAVVVTVGPSNLFFRGDYSTGLDKTASLLFDKAIRPIPVFAFMMTIVSYRQLGKKTASFYICLALTLIADFPTAMARYNMACLYGALALLLFQPLFNKKGLFSILFLLAFLILFPAGNSYRQAGANLLDLFDSIQKSILNLPRGFCAVDYDAYSMFSRTVDYIESNGITFGYQLLGVFLFFVPRAIWPGKPEGSGNLVGIAQNQSILNISLPFPSEGIINFGIIGLVVFAIVLAVACRKLDLEFIKEDGKPEVRLFYLLLYFLLFFILRGDLLSSWAYTVGYVVSFFAVYKVSTAFDAKVQKHSDN